MRTWPDYTEVATIIIRAYPSLVKGLRYLSSLKGRLNEPSLEDGSVSAPAQC